MPIPDLTPVKSSNIEAVGHEGDTLYVRFKNSGTYAYKGVDAAKHQALIGADSVGKYLAEHIRSKHEGVKLPTIKVEEDNG